MPKKIAQKTVSQTRQVLDEALREAADQPKKMVGQAFEQLGVRSGGQQSQPQASPHPDLEKQRLEAMEAQDKQKTDQAIANLKRELEEEIRKYQELRKAQMRQRRQAAAEETAVEPPKKFEQPKPKRSRRFLAGLRRRKEQSQPELVGRRVGR